MPSIYPTLKHSDRKHIRNEKARIRQQFSDLVKQKELISELYKKMLPVAVVLEKKESKAEVKKPAPKKVTPKKVTVKK